MSVNIVYTNHEISTERKDADVTENEILILCI